ncbi:MOSC domain-containing protein [Mangrovicoccus sp. HB161399]|uniref:MOSC domain-containing protein n=1 Tax=Mangrovicoccus sp. HB161399 TaxID=2720392 RepID=UPI001556EAB7|nr:MOSC domain-containing protein [Mangrovicoccus sp. HB161399]
MEGRVLGVYSGRARPELFDGRPGRTGYRRKAWDRPAPVGREGLLGDELADSRRLGRENHAVYLFCRAHYPAYEAELGRALPPASFAENVLYDGPDETGLRIGDLLALGTAVLRVTTPRIPCYKLRHFLGAPQGFVTRFSASGRTGVYTSVHRAGEIGVGDAVARISTDPRNATVAELNAVLTGFDLDPDLVERVLASPDLLPGAAEIVRERVARFRPELASGPLACLIAARRSIAPDAAEIDIAPFGTPPPGWQPGQFITLGHAFPGAAPVYRCYSLIAGPAGDAPDAPYTIAVRARAGAGPAESLSARLVHGDAAGQTALFYPPSGDFLLPVRGTAPLVYIAGGIGITPVLSHLRALRRARPDRRIAAVYVVRSAGSAVYAEELAGLARTLPDMEADIWLTGSGQAAAVGHARGRPDLGAFLARFRPDAEVFACGPLAMIEDVRRAFAAQGRPPEALHFELFGLPPAGDGAGTAGRAEVSVAGTGIGAEWTPPDGALLDWLEARSSLRPPAACRSGLCRTCEAALEEGAVAYPAGIVPPDPGRVLLCCARPATDTIRIGLPPGTARHPAGTPQEADR